MVFFQVEALKLQISRLTYTVSISVHSNKVELMKTPKPTNLVVFNNRD